MTKFARAYMSFIKDPRTQVKTYGGLIHNDMIDSGFENECFTFLFINTDNTMRNVEAAYLIVAAQLNAAELDMYNYTKGTIEKKEITVKFNGYPITNAYVDMVASDMMKFLLSREAGARQIILNSTNFMYTGLDTAAKTLKNYGASSKLYPSLNLQNVSMTYEPSAFYQTTNEGLDTTYMNPENFGG